MILKTPITKTSSFDGGGTDCSMTNVSTKWAIAQTLTVSRGAPEGAEGAEIFRAILPSPQRAHYI